MDSTTRTLERCSHHDPTATRVAHGYLGDAPAGTVQTLCTGCGIVLAPHVVHLEPYGAGYEQARCSCGWRSHAVAAGRGVILERDHLARYGDGRRLWHSVG